MFIPKPHCHSLITIRLRPDDINTIQTISKATHFVRHCVCQRQLLPSKLPSFQALRARTAYPLYVVDKEACLGFRLGLPRLRFLTLRGNGLQISANTLYLIGNAAMIATEPLDNVTFIAVLSAVTA
jgi:hypothetical protein